MSSESMNHKRVASLPDRMTLSPEPSSPKSTGSNSRRRSKRVKTDAQSKTFVWSGPFVPFKYFVDIGGQTMETCQLQHVVVHVLFLKEATPVQKVRDCMQKYTKEIQDLQQEEHELALEKFEVDSLPIEVVLSGTESLYKKTRAIDKDMVFQDGVHISPETKQTHLLNGIRKMLQKVQNTTKEKVYGKNCSSEGLVVFLKHPCLKDRILLSYTAYDMEYFLKTLSVNFRTKRLIPITSMYSPDCTALMRAFIEKFESAAGVLNGNEMDVHFMCRQMNSELFSNPVLQIKRYFAFTYTLMGNEVREEDDFIEICKKQPLGNEIPIVSAACGKDVHGFFYAAFHTSQPATVDCVQRYLQKYIKENKLNINFYPFTMGETYDRYVIEGFTSLWELSNDVIGKMIREASAKGLAFHQWSMTLSSNMSFDRHMPVPCEIDKQFQHLRNALVATQTQRLSKDSTHMLEEQKAVLQTQIRFMVQRISHLEDCMRQKDERITILTEENDSLIDDVSSLNKDIKEMKGVIVKVQGYFKTFSTSMLASGL